MFRFINDIEPTDRNVAILLPVTHSRMRFTKGEKMPAGKVVKPHAVSSLNISSSSNNNNGHEGGGPLAYSETT